ncbi:crotonobetainyl-CoA:carnitine CoA-transferase CaiB-like acyl-CoA transferase [Bradyrhizobium sp. USDA 4518]
MVAGCFETRVIRSGYESTSRRHLRHAIAAPSCTRQLADLGARVIEVERPSSRDFAPAYDARVTGRLSHFFWTTRSKESLVLDLKDPEQLDLIEQLVAKADVLVQNLAPSATTRMGLSWEAPSIGHPPLIACDISEYGDNGRYRAKKAYDLLIQAEAGLLTVMGTPETPCKSGNSIADIAAAMCAYSSIVAALLQCQRSGRRIHIEVSMLESSSNG